jgi:integrase/recombinase XerC
MIKIPALHLPLRDWLLEGPLSAQVPAYVVRLKRGGYAPHTCERNLNALAHFAHWLEMCHLPVHMLDEGCIDHFLRYHLPSCDCLGGVLRSPTEAHAALIPLLEILRIENIVAPPFTPTGPIADELCRYETYMCEVRGLASGTRTNRLRIVERLLQSKFSGRPVDFGELQTEDVRKFIAEQLDFLGTASNATAIASSLRAYLQYRATCGDTVQPMLAVIASPAHWSMASLPRALTPDEVDRLLSSFTSVLPSPHRGYAIVRLALDLGLRGIEINRLKLSDIDWLRGTITLKGTKSKRQDILPLPTSTGRALEAYLRHERPKTSDAAVFVRRMAPHDEPIGVDAIRRIVRDAFRRAGIPHGRGHALRHTVACRIVNQGSSIKEVADVLRHRSLNTSMIYAKLDHGALSGVALPWPGSPA